MTTSTSATFRAPSTLVLGNTIVVGSTSLTTPEVRAQRANVDVLVADGAQGAHGMTVANAVTFTNAAFAGPMVEKRVADSSRWGLGVSGAGVGAQSRTDVYTSATGIVTLGHALNDATVQPAVVLTRALGAATANVGINTSAPTAALHVAGNLLIQSGTFTADDHMDVFPDMPDHRIGTYSVEFLPTLMTGTTTERLYYGTFSTTTNVNSQVTAARPLFTTYTSLFNNPTLPAQSFIQWGQYMDPAPGGLVANVSNIGTGVGVTRAWITLDNVYLLNRGTQTYAASPTTLNGFHTFMTFPRKFTVRHVWMVPGILRNMFDTNELLSLVNRAPYSSFQSLPDQIYVLGTNETTIGRGTVWYEIDFVTAPRQPEQLFERTFTIGTSPALSTFRTIGVVYHRIKTGWAKMCAVSRLRFIGTPTADRTPVRDLILHEPFYPLLGGSEIMPNTRQVTDPASGTTVTVTYAYPGTGGKSYLWPDLTRGMVMLQTTNVQMISDRILPFGPGAEGSYTKALWIRHIAESATPGDGQLISAVASGLSGQDSTSRHFMEMAGNAVRVGHGMYGPNDIILTSTAIPSGASAVWTHFAFTWDNVTKVGTLYQNGALAAVQGGTGNPVSRPDLDHSDCMLQSAFGQHGITIGSGSGISGNFYRGRLDDIRVYARALTAAEVQALYNATSVA